MRLICALFLLPFIVSCVAKNPAEPEPFNAEYKVHIPEGKLPWPHQSPELTEEQYHAFVENIWIINNYGLHVDPQGVNEIPRNDNAHDGLDIVTSANAHIYSIEPGYVYRASNFVIAIGDRQDRFAPDRTEWRYGHVDNYQVLEGQRVGRGQYIGDEAFGGTPHIHLTKALGNDAVFPDDYFVYNDTIAPIIQLPFFFFRNNSNDQILPVNDTLVVSGEVDLIVGIREAGQYAHSHDPHEPPFGDRLAVTGASYAITTDSISPHFVDGVDFRTLGLQGGWEPDIAKLYKPYALLATDSSWNARFSFYILSNFDSPIRPHSITAIDANNCWRTNQRDARGNPLFPNGVYKITVKAWDAKSNMRETIMNVVVRNG